MIKTAHNERLVKRLPPATKCAMGIPAMIGGRQTIADLSRHFQCSRTTVYEQKNRALQAAVSAFEESDDQTLLTLSVTKSVIHKMGVALFLICRSSYRGIMFFLESMLGYSLSLGTVFNILDAAADKAASINNDAYDLGAIRSSAADELFHRNQPLLGVVDIDSRFCALLAKSQDRDHESWGIHLLGFVRQGGRSLSADGSMGSDLNGTYLRKNIFNIK